MILLVFEACFFLPKAQRYNAKGIHLAKKEKYTEAKKYLDLALELNSKYEDALINRGICYWGIKDNKKAFGDFNKCLTLNPANHRCYFVRGQFREDIGDFKGALKDYQRAIIHKEDEYIYYNYYGRLLASVDSSTQALPYLNIATEKRAYDKCNVKEEIDMLKKRCEERVNKIKSYE